MAKKSKHLHRYKRDVLGRAYVIYKCTLPGCTHYIPENLLPNRVAMCGNCEETIVIDKIRARQAVPRCDNCTKLQVDDITLDIAKVLEER